MLSTSTRGHRLALAALALALGCGGPATRCHDGMADHARMHADHDHTASSAQHDFSDVARFEAMFEAPDRPGWQHPVEVVAMLEVDPGETVVDLGTGTGYFLPFLAIAVGPRGRVIALDTEPAMIEHVRARASREGIVGVDARVVQPADPGLEPQSVDAVLVVDTWHHLTDRAAYATRLREALRTGGTLLVIDWTTEATRGPPEADRVSPETVALELTNAGFEVAVLEEALPEQYAVRGRRTDARVHGRAAPPRAAM